MSRRRAVPAAVLGATGAVGQRLVRRLADHPWLRPAELLASEASAGVPYAEAAPWVLDRPPPAEVRGRAVRPVGADVDSEVVFSALPSGVAGPVEEDYAGAGRLVVTNARDHRMDPDVPLVVPEVNPDHLALAERQRHPGGGRIVANPNCSAIGLVLPLAPLAEAFGIHDVQVVTMQAISGAGHPGVSGLDIQDNVIPRIGGEEEKLGREPHKILGSLHAGDDGGAVRVEPAEMRVSAQCNRVPVVDGHLQAVSVRLGTGGPTDPDRVRRAWREYRGAERARGLPSAPERPLRYEAGENAPQPRRHRTAGGGMTVTVGRLRSCPVLDVRFVTVSHNTVRGAAGGAILTAELVIGDEGGSSEGGR